MSEIRIKVVNDCNIWRNFYLSRIQHNTEKYKYYKEAHDSCMKSEPKEEYCRSFGETVDSYRELIHSYNEKLANNEYECETASAYSK